MSDPNGPANMVAEAVFWTVGIVVLIGIGRLWDRFATRRIRRALDAARGDRQVIRDFSAEVDRWDAEQTARARRTR